MEPAIFVHDLCKQYTRGIQQAPYVALRDVLSASFRKKNNRDRRSKFWALRGIGFEVQPGERIGIIGRNGAGKSTLLKIISRITPPTSGKVVLNGRVASLLEVGTGFHPELTGRENIFLNGAILGLKKAEIEARLDEIIDFSGVEAFIDTPLKHYSSGMQLRLAFSVAAHLEADILLIDEVLAVGDYEFQQKCLGKMKELSHQANKTIVFVSHDLHAIANLTDKCILLKEGTVEAFGPTDVIVRRYIDHFKKTEAAHLPEHPEQPHFRSLKLTASDQSLHDFGKTLSVSVQLAIPSPVNALEFSYQICNEATNEPVVYNWFSSARDLESLLNKTGLFSVTIEIPSLRLYKGNYYFRFFLSDPRGKTIYQTVENALPFEVTMKGISNEWGWQENVCRYIETYTLKIEQHEQFS